MSTPETPRTGSLQRLHPLTKLAAALLLVVAAYTLPGIWPPLAILLLVLALALYGGVARSVTRTMLQIIAPIVLSLFLIQGILFPPIGATPLPLGPITLTVEGLVFATTQALRLATLSATVLLLLALTHASDLVHALTERGLPRSIGYILLVSLQVVPDMSARASAILDAQRARGLETQGGLRPLFAIVPLLGPLVVGALVDVQERAMAIESRAYTAPGPKTSLRQLTDTPAQVVARTLLLLAVLSLIGYRSWQAFGGQL